MRKASAAVLIAAVFAGPAAAHKDRIVHIKADGSMPDIPAEFGKARLIVERLGSEAPFIQLQIGKNQTTLPSCVTRMIRTRNKAAIEASASWYHDEKDSLPYYLEIQFLEPGYKPERPYNSSYKFMFNLHNAKLIHAGAFKATQSGYGGQGMALKLPQGCNLHQDI